MSEQNQHLDPSDVYEPVANAIVTEHQEPAPVKRFLSKAEIFAIPDIKIEEVWIEQWGTYVRIRGMTGAERDAYEMDIIQGKGKNTELNRRNLRAKLVVRTVLDGDNKPLFDLSDVRKLGEKSAAALDRMYDVAARLSGLSDEDADELGKPSESDQSDGSTSA